MATNIISKLSCGVASYASAYSTLQDSFSSLEENFNSLENNLKTFQKETEDNIDDLNKKTQLLFNQIINNNKIISAYVKEQLFNLERVRLECKRENLAHIIEEEVMEKRIIWIVALPWYKKITKKQQIKLITKMQLIRDEVEDKYKSKMDEVMLEIKNHTRENFFAELNRVTNDLREKKNG